MNFKKISLFFLIIIILIQFISLETIAAENTDENKVYIFAGDYNYPPFEFVDNVSKFTGFNVDIIRAVAKEAGIRIQIVPMEWSTAMESLDNGEIDGIIGMAYSKERAEKYDFATTSIVHEQVIFVEKNTFLYNSLEDLNGAKVAFQKADINQSIFVQIPDAIGVPMKSHEESFIALKKGEVDAVLANKLVGLYHIQKNKLSDYIKISGYPLKYMDYGPVVAKGDKELLDKINTGMEIVLQDKYYKPIYNKWIGQDINNIKSILKAYQGLIMAITFIILTLFIILFSYSKILQKQVNKRTYDLEKANRDLIKHQKEIFNLAYFDTVTSLPNRTYFVEELDKKCNNFTSDKDKFAILFLDIDKFKFINDTLGHHIGDYILKLMGNRLSKLIGENDLLARVSGDEYYILIDKYKSIEDINNIAKKIIHDFKLPYYIKDYTLYLTTSIGIATYPEGGSDSSSLIKNVDLALYKSKDLGGNTYYIYGDEIESQGLERMLLLNQLRHAIEFDELVLHYQPQFSIETQELTGLEALVRWQHPTKGLLFPDQFIPLAEEAGLIISMGKWILDKACMVAKSWHDEGHDIYISVNISSRQFQHNEFIDEVKNAIKISKLNPSRLVLEITESTAISDMDRTLMILNEFKKLGIAVAIDDFGTGYSSLSYLNDMSVNELKIDRSFIWDIEKNDKNKMIANTIILLGKQLGMAITAEGVENLEQLGILKEMKCDYAQGYYFSKPVSKENIDKMLKERL